MLDTGERLDLNIETEAKNGQKICLSPSLVLRQGLKQPAVDRILMLHREKQDYFDLMRATDEPAELQKFAEEVKCIEFELQEAWGFPQDATFHDWYRVPKCQCPTMDNDDRKGTPYGVISGKCPIHNV